MARPSPYTEGQKTAILDAVKAARKTGTWPDALKAAKEAGFKGKLPYLMKFAGGGTRKGKRRMGRPKGSKTPPAAAIRNGSGLGAIDQIVERMVEQRVGVAVSRAVASLERAAKALKSL